MKSITVDGVEYVPADSALCTPDVSGLRYCIVRCRDAGVHAGYVKSTSGREVVLLKSRRLWRWHAKTLSGLATEGTTNASRCKYANEVPEITLLDACEIIPCTGAGRNSVTGMPEWKNE